MVDHLTAQSTSGVKSARSGTSKQWNTPVEKWLIAKGIDLKIAQKLGVKWQGSTIQYPRVSKGQLGWTFRDLAQNKRWADPSGISHNDVTPWITTEDFPRGTKNLVILEGESDFLRWHSLDVLPSGSWSALMCPGATAFPNGWASVLAGFDNVYVLPDGDPSGELMMARISTLCPRARWVRLPAGRDVCDAAKEIQTRWMWATLFNDAQPYNKPVKLLKSTYSSRDGDASKFRFKLMDYLTEDGVHLKRRSTNELVGLCPFHEEKTPSFFVNTEKGTYYCQGCDVRGDVINYLVNKRGMSMYSAFRKVEQA